MNFFRGINIFTKFIQIIKVLFWKNDKIFYIHSNKKIFDFSIIDSRAPIANYKIIKHESLTKIGYKFTETHFRKSRVLLYQISRNLKYNPEINYAGYLSVPFAIYDGFCLGDNRDYKFYDTLKEVNKAYKITFSKKRIKQNSFNIPIDIKEVDLFINASYQINQVFSNTGHLYQYNVKSGDKITSEYLSDVLYFVGDFLDSCRDANVKKVHLYCSSKQPVSFVVGLSIQSHHPLVTVYEFENGKYTWSIEIQNAKIIKENKNGDT